MTISERAAGRGFVLGSEGLGFLAVLTADVGFEVLWRLQGRQDRHPCSPPQGRAAPPW